MDPLSALAIASAAFKAIKRGVEVGNDLENMTGDLSRWVGAISNIRDSTRKAKNPSMVKSFLKPGSVEQEAIDAFAANKKAEAMEYELKLFINMQYGPQSWNEILRMQGEIRKGRLQEKRRQQELFETVLTWAIVVAIFAMCTLMTVFIFAKV